MLKANSLSHQGLVRGSNEDAVLENESLGLWAVADGVGGNTCGEVASQLAVQTIERRVRQGESITDAIFAANQAIRDAVDDNPDYQSMATTVVVCHFQEGHFEVAWVGDSRAYLIDQSGMHQLTSDHNVANELFEQGVIEDIDLHDHPGQHELTQALGQLSLENVPKSLGELHDGDYLLLCTDGLSGVLEDLQILETVRENTTIDTACEALLTQVLDAGAPDNVSFSLIQYKVDAPQISQKDFKNKGFRAPFDRSAYDLHCHNRPLLLTIILISIFILLVFV